MDKLDLILQKLEKLDKIEADITGIKNNIKTMKNDIESIKEVTVTIMENQTDHKQGIQALEQKTAI
jgi:hypothetical protein